LSALTEAEKERINQLLEKFTNKTLKKEDEVKELQVLLEKRKKEAFDLGDFLLATGTVFLLAGLIGYIFEK
jgi:hypothetical protein